MRGVFDSLEIPTELEEVFPSEKTGVMAVRPRNLQSVIP